jgi:hypothetical protein
MKNKEIIEYLENVRQHLINVEKVVECYNLDTDIEDLKKVEDELEKKNLDKDL